MVWRQAGEGRQVLDPGVGLDAAQSIDLHKIRVDGHRAEAAAEATPHLVDAPAAADIDQHEFRTGDGLGQVAQHRGVSGGALHLYLAPTSRVGRRLGKRNRER
jgi:hypothetical protein